MMAAALLLASLLIRQADASSPWSFSASSSPSPTRQQPSPFAAVPLSHAYGTSVFLPPRRLPQSNVLLRGGDSTKAQQRGNTQAPSATTPRDFTEVTTQDSATQDSMPSDLDAPADVVASASSTTDTRGGGVVRPANITTTIYGEEEIVSTTTELVPQRRRSRNPLAFLSKRKHSKTHKLIAKKLKNRNHTNLRRKIMHAAFGFGFAILHHLTPQSKFVPGMTALTSATLLMELLRYRKHFGWMNDILHFVLGSSLRKHEMDGKFTGSFYYFLGVTTTAALYPKAAATMGILQLAIADPTASYFGRRTRHVYWSRIENGLGGFGRNKGILGFLGGAVACVPNNYRMLSLAKFASPVPQSQLWMASFALGLAGAFADLAVPTPTLTLPKKICGIRVPPFHIDDNFVVPVVSGYACTKIFSSLSWPLDLELSPLLWA